MKVFNIFCIKFMSTCDKNMMYMYDNFNKHAHARAHTLIHTISYHTC